MLLLIPYSHKEIYTIYSTLDSIGTITFGPEARKSIFMMAPLQKNPMGS